MQTAVAENKVDHLCTSFSVRDMKAADDDMSDDLATNVTSPHVSNITRCGDSVEITGTYPSHSQQIRFTSSALARSRECGRKYHKTESFFKMS